jgi:hypothetical protein
VYERKKTAQGKTYRGYLLYLRVQMVSMAKSKGKILVVDDNSGIRAEEIQYIRLSRRREDLDMINLTYILP